MTAQEQPSVPPGEGQAPEEQVPAAQAPEAAVPQPENGQDAEAPEGRQRPQSAFGYKMNRRGDQFIKISLSLDIPLGMKGLNLGGSGTIGYSYFLFDNFSVGGEANFSYMTTIGSNVFYYVPLIARATYQFTAGRFEIPLSVGVGITFQSYLNRNYYGLIIKPEVGGYFRYSPDWSFGLAVALNVLPQWYSNKSYNRVGNILDVSASVRYHF